MQTIVLDSTLDIILTDNNIYQITFLKDVSIQLTTSNCIVKITDNIEADNWQDMPLHLLKELEANRTYYLQNFSNQDAHIAKMQDFTESVISKDIAGNTGLISPFLDTLVAEKNADVSVQFQYNQLNTEFDLNADATITTGDGVIQSTGSYAEASSASSGTATIQTRDRIRYKPGFGGYAYFTASFQGAGTGYHGSWDDADGFAIKVSNGVMSFGYIKSGIEKGSWGGDGFDSVDTSGIDLTKVNIYMIVFGYLGVANPTLLIKQDNWRVLHIVLTEGRLDGTHVDNPVFPITMRAIDGMTMKMASCSGGIIGDGNKTGNRGFAFPNQMVTTGSDIQGQVTLSGTTVSTVVLFRSKASFGSKTNKVKSILSAYDFHINIPSGNNTGEVVFQIVKVNTLSGVGTWTDINTNSSIMEYDHSSTGASVTVTDGTPLITKIVEYAGEKNGGSIGSITLDAEQIGVTAYSGDIFAILAKDNAGHNVTIQVSANWSEQF